MKPKFAFMGSPEIAVPFLDALHKNGADMIVFTKPDKIRSRGRKTEPTPVKRHATELDIPVYTTSSKEKESIEILNKFQPHFLFVVAFGEILKKSVLEIPSICPLNVHFSLLPQYRGPTPVNTALLHGREKTGTTIIKMNRKMDEGNIIYQEEISIDPEDNASSLFKKLTDLSINLLEKHWSELIKGDFTETPQKGQATYTSFIHRKDRLLNWEEPAEKLHNRVRAFTDFPGVRTRFRRKNICIMETRTIDCDYDTEAGTVVSVSSNKLTVACGEKAIELVQLKPAGKRCMDISCFISGYKPMKGEKFF